MWWGFFLSYQMLHSPVYPFEGVRQQYLVKWVIRTFDDAAWPMIFYELLIAIGWDSRYTSLPKKMVEGVCAHGQPMDISRSLPA